MLSTRNRRALCVGLLSAISLGAAAQAPYHFNALHGPGGSDGIANDLNGHGTNVSGIVTGDGVLAPIGMAPGASIVAVRVLDRNNAGFTSDWVAGLDWVYTNRATLGAKVVNMSLGTSMLYTGNCDAQQGAMKAAVANLRDAGVVIFASSGNDRSNDKVRSPACVTGVVAVGATYDVGSARVPDAGTFQRRRAATARTMKSPRCLY